MKWWSDITDHILMTTIKQMADTISGWVSIQMPLSIWMTFCMVKIQARVITERHPSHQAQCNA